MSKKGKEYWKKYNQKPERKEYQRKLMAARRAQTQKKEIWDYDQMFAAHEQEETQIIDVNPDGTFSFPKNN